MHGPILLRWSTIGTPGRSPTPSPGATRGETNSLTGGSERPLILRGGHIGTQGRPRWNTVRSATSFLRHLARSEDRRTDTVQYCTDCPRHRRVPPHSGIPEANVSHGRVLHLRQGGIPAPLYVIGDQRLAGQRQGTDDDAPESDLSLGKRWHRYQDSPSRQYWPKRRLGHRQCLTKTSGGSRVRGPSVRYAASVSPSERFSILNVTARMTTLDLIPRPMRDRHVTFPTGQQHPRSRRISGHDSTDASFSRAHQGSCCVALHYGLVGRVLRHLLDS